MANKLQLKKGTKAQLDAMTTPLANGEPGYVTDEKHLVIGDGTDVVTFVNSEELSEIEEVATHSNRAILDATTASYTSAEKTKLNAISIGAEANQNAFSKVTVGTISIEADNETDEMTLVAGSNVDIALDTTNDKITISATDTTYGLATSTSNGLMSSAEKNKLSEIAEGAEVNVNADWDATSGDAQILNKPTSLPASDVSAWAKASTKPSYTASEVGADAVGSSASALVDAKSYTDTKINTTNSDVSELDTRVNTLETDTHTHSNKVILDEIKATDITNWDSKDAGGSAQTVKDYVDNTVYPNATSYVDTKIADLIGTSPENLNSIYELAEAIQESQSAVDVLNEAITTKANQTELDTHTANTTVHITSTEHTGLTDSISKKHSHDNKSVIDGITSVLITAWNSAVTHISDTVKHITATERTLWNTVSNKVNKENGKGLSTNDYTTVEKTKLSNIEESANNYSLPTATATVLGGVKTGSNITNTSGTISLTKANVTSALGYTPPEQDTNTTYDVVSTTADGLVPMITGTTIKFLRDDGTWSIPPDTNTTYSAGDGISLDGKTFNNSGVRNIVTGTINGTISVNTNGTSTDVQVKGLGSAAYTDSDSYATKASEHTHSNKTTLDTITSSKVTSWDNKSDFSGSYDDLTDTPIIPIVTNDLTDTLKSNYNSAYTHSISSHARTDATKVEASEINGNVIINDVETTVYELPSNVAKTNDLHSHANKIVLDGISSEKVTEWDNKSNFSGDYLDLTNKPTIPTVTNDLTDELKTNYDSAYTHSVSTHARTDATKVESSLMNGNIKINGTETIVYTLPSDIAKTSDLHSHTNKTTLDKLSESDGTLLFDGNEIQGGGEYTLPTASNTTLGGVKVDGTTVTVSEDGTISSVGGSGTGLTNIGIALLKDNWTYNTTEEKWQYEVTIAGMTSNNAPSLGIVPPSDNELTAEQIKLYRNLQAYTSDGKLIVYSRIEPLCNVSIVVTDEVQATENVFGNINEVVENIGSLPTLTTTDKTDLVSAINEVKQETTLNNSLSVRYDPETNWVQILVDGIWENWSEGLIRELLIVNNSVITSEAKNIVSAFTASAGINAPGYTPNLTKSTSFLTGSKTIIGYDVTFNWSVTDSGYPQLVNMKVTFNRDEQKAVTFNGGSGSKTITINNINTKTLTIDLLCNNHISVPESFNVTITALNARFA